MTEPKGRSARLSRHLIWLAPALLATPVVLWRVLGDDVDQSKHDVRHERSERAARASASSLRTRPARNASNRSRKPQASGAQDRAADGSSEPSQSSQTALSASSLAVSAKRLCLKLKECGLPQLTAALKTGRATPHTLFDWAISQRASDLVRTSALPLWDDYVRLGDFAPETRDALLHRPDPR
jgi:hypothetical protein